MKRIILCDQVETVDYVYSDETFNELRKYGFDDQRYEKKDVIKNPCLFKETEYIFSTWGIPQFSEDEIKTLFPNLKSVFYAAGSVQSFARPFIQCGVKVFSAWAANAVPVAEYTVAQIILANKGFYIASKIYNDKNYEQAREVHSHYQGNYGSSVGIIGAGMIGKLVIEKLKEYKLNVKVFDPFLPDEIAFKLGVEKVSLDEMFSTCTVVSNHLANNEQTKNMLNYNLFSAMQPYATFINTGRGAQVVEADLIKLLEERPDIAAVLDVTFPEPPVLDSKLYTLSNCILTPHIAGSAGNEVHRMAEYMLEEFENLISGKPCRYEVTEKMLETMA